MPQTRYETLSATIADGASLSSTVTLNGRHIVGIITPATLAGTSLTFQGAADGATFNNIFDTAGSEVTWTISTSRFIPVTPATFAGLQSVKLRTGTSGSPSAQSGADRVITVVVRTYE